MHTRMRFRFILVFLVCLVTVSLSAQNLPKSLEARQESEDSFVTAYTDSLTNWLTKRATAKRDNTTPSPYLFRIFAPGTVYRSALQQKMMPTSAKVPSKLPSLGNTDDPQLLLNEAINEQLDVAYIQNPGSFATTQELLMSGNKLRSDLAQPVEEKTVLAVAPPPVEMPDVPVNDVEPEVKKPNFWTFKGNGSLQFTQNYFSDNWFQGGEKNYSMLAQLNVEANYDNKQKIQWDNKLEGQLGFQTSETDQYHNFKATANEVRFTTKFGYKAAANWNYAAQLQLQSQPYMNFEKNGPNVISDFLSPLTVRFSIGMDFKIKKKRFDGSLYLSPMSYVITYVDRDNLISRYGIHEGHNSKHEWGPNVNFNFTYKMWKNISWTSRLYWFSNLHLTRVEWENTLNFAINRYMSTKLFLYPRFDDSSIKYKSGEDHSGSYFMFKEWLSLGLSYDF